MSIPEFKRVDIFQQVADSIDLARELSIELETRTSMPSEADIHAAVDVMNHHLFGVGGNKPALIKAESAFVNLPNNEFDAEFLPDSLIEQARVEQAIVRGRIESFHWLGSTAISAFGVNISGAELIAPRKQFLVSAFIPVEGISLHLAA